MNIGTGSSVGVLMSRIPRWDDFVPTASIDGPTVQPSLLIRLNTRKR